MNNDNVTVDRVVFICDPNDIVIEWRDIPGFSNYQASSLGIIRNKKTGRLSTLYKIATSVGTYFRVSAVSDDRRYRSKEVHHLVCRAFHGLPPSDKHEVNHKDGNKHHNYPDNVEWMTRGENIKHAYETGLRKDGMPVIVQDIMDGTESRYETMNAAARALGIKPSMISTIIRKHRKIPFQGRYLFAKDYSDRKVTEWDWVRDIVIYDYVDDRLVLATDAGQAEWITGVNRGTISWRLQDSTKRDDMIAGYIFRYLDELSNGSDDLPQYDRKEALYSRTQYRNKKPPREKRFGVRMRNYRTGDVSEYDTINDAAKDTGVDGGTIRYLMNSVDQKLFKGLIFQYKDDPRDFPEFDKETIEVSLIKKKPEFPSLRVNDLETNTTKLYPSAKEFASQIAQVSGTAISRHIRVNPDKPYRNRYLFELVY